MVSLKGHSPQFLANVRYGQTAGWTKIPLCMEVGLGPGDLVFDGDPASPGKKAHPPSHTIFDPRLLSPNDWMDEDATWYRSRPRPGHIVFRRGPRCPRKGHSSTSLFGPCLLLPRSPISATAKPLFNLYVFYFHKRWKKGIHLL